MQKMNWHCDSSVKGDSDYAVSVGVVSVVDDVVRVSEQVALVVDGF